MSQRVFIRHSTGSKASTVEEFTLTAAQELTFGRETSCDVRFDKDRDEYVSRRHMKLVAVDPDRMDFNIVELSARNGTFVNRKRVRGEAKLRSGDLVQLGAGGPEFTFDVGTPDLKVTPISGVVPVEDLTRTPPAASVPVDATPPVVPAPPVAPSPPATEILQSPVVSQQRRPARGSRKKRVAGIVILVALGAAGGAYLAGYRLPVGAALETGGKEPARDGLLSPEEVARQNAESIVTVENAWKVIDPSSGKTLRQIYIANRRDAAGATPDPLVPGAGAELPVFVLATGNRVFPLLTVADHASYQPIGGTLRTAGFVIGNDGLVLTGRASARPWSAAYDWPAADSAGVVVVFDAQSKLGQTAVIARRQFPRWMPTDTEFVLNNGFDKDAVSVNSRIHGDGKSDRMVVRGAEQSQGNPAAVVTVSDDTGFATIRPNGGSRLRKASIAPAAETHAGDELIYITPRTERSGTVRLSILPDGRYVLPMSADVAAGSGAPLFDRQGRVAAVQTDADPLQPDRLIAIPIRRALDSVGQALSENRP
jgi:hypothetical protein